MTKSDALAMENSTNVRNKTTKTPLLGMALGLLWRVFPTVAKRLTNRLFFTPKRRPLSEEQKRLLQTGTAFELAVNKRRFKCWRWGNGWKPMISRGESCECCESVLF